MNHVLSKSSQVTIFFIVGIVFIILFGLVYMVVNDVSSSKTDQNINKVTSSQTDISNIKAYVQTGLDDLSRDAIEMMGLQGGYIYSYQIPGGYPFDRRFGVEFYSDYLGKRYKDYTPKDTNLMLQRDAFIEFVKIRVKTDDTRPKEDFIDFDGMARKSIEEYKKGKKNGI